MSNKEINYKTIETNLAEFDATEVTVYLEYIRKLQTEKDKFQEIKFKSFFLFNNDNLTLFFKKAKKNGLAIDGKHVSLINRGGISIQYDYIAYKNRLLFVYPESKITFDVVYKDDSFSFENRDGKIIYHHKYANPFENKDDKIIGAYCIIKNKRGEFIKTLSKVELDQLKGIAKTKYIWDTWYKDMCIKSVIKKLVSKHFNDIYTEIETEDNKNYDLSKNVNVKNQECIDKNQDFFNDVIEKINNIDSLKELGEYYKKITVGVDLKKKKAIHTLVLARRQEIKELLTNKKDNA